MPHETMEYDVVIVGAGPAGLSAGIKLKQLSLEAQVPLSVCIIEKGAYVGAHILSGAAFEPRALNELIPNWRERGAPLNTPAYEDKFIWLTEKKAFRLPTPPQMQNQGNYIISLGNFCRWLASEAEQLGVEIYPGFAAKKVLYNNQGHVCGIATEDRGLGKDGQPTPQFQPGMHLFAKQTIFAEGCRGSLTKELIAKFNLNKNSCPQTYGIGIKELWEVDSKQHVPGLVLHTFGWPLENNVYGGSFLYHFDHNKVSVGFVVGLDYKNPYLNPFEECQRFKTHPRIRPYFENAQRIGYGSRAISEGGFQSIPKLTFPGGLLIGDTAGFLNVPKIKGSHTAMKSGITAAEAVFSALKNSSQNEVTEYPELLKKTWLWDELYKERNIRPAFRKGLWAGLTYAAIDTYLLRGHAPWTFKHVPDHSTLTPAAHCQPINYPKPDGKITFDKLSSVYLSNTNHPENQPCHLQLKDPSLAISVNFNVYDSPETRYCPANVYEIVYSAEKKPYLQINAQNCVHCKTCDIKDPMQNIIWVPPEGGGGPHYTDM